MHSLHILRVKADSLNEACQTAEAEILDWGNENNWRVIIGAISDEGEWYEHSKEGRWSVSDTTAEALEQLVQESLTPEKWEVGRFKELTGRYTDGKELKTFDWYEIKRFADLMLDIGYTEKDFDIWEHEFRSWKLNDFGVTDLMGDGRRQYLVLVDMHS